jgi:hypothetical protein
MISGGNKKIEETKVKQYLMFIIVLLSFGAILSAAEKTEPSEAAEVANQIAKLNKMIIPPEGTEKAKVDAVYGEPKGIEELNGKGSPALYPIHIYRFLASKENQEFRAILYVSYRNEQVWKAGINHSCVLKNRAIYKDGSPEDQKQILEIENENKAVLIDLKEISEKYSEKLKRTSWNNNLSEPAADKSRDKDKVLEEEKKPLVDFAEQNFGVRFSHTATLSTSYNPHGGADRVTLTYHDKPLGGLVVRPAPPAGQIERFIEGGKAYYKEKWGASTVDYKAYVNPGEFKFHHLKTEVKQKGEEYILERYVHLREDGKTPPDIADNVLRSMSGAYSFEFIYLKKEADVLGPEIKIVIDTFKIDNGSSKPSSK